jgi:arginyl-tRNA synthetase
VILADLDRELAVGIAALVADGVLPPAASGIAPGHCWRLAPDGNPASFATSLAFELAALADREPADIAARLVPSLAQLPSVAAAELTGRGYLTITVTARALGQAARRIAAAGPDAARSTILAGTTASAAKWPDIAAALTWRDAWQEHTAAVTGRLAVAAGASATATMTGERGSSGADAAGAGQPTVAAAVAWYGVHPVRYGLTRTTAEQVPRLGEAVLSPGVAGADSLYPVRQAHTSAESTLRWADELGLPADDPGERAGDVLVAPAERSLLGLLPWLPVRVASAARRHRPGDIPGYLETVCAAWLAVRQTAPALAFGGGAAPADAETATARLMLADAVRAVLAAGLALVGASVCSEDD